MTTHPRTLVLALGLAAIMGGVGVAAVFLSSWLVAAIIGALTIAAVIIDTIACARLADPDAVAPDPTATPQAISVDLRRRP